ncbi:MAG TPA: hypothetical protein VK970_06325 [Candidatus Methylacidiphilales bacterium]|nr:hypothetical protein [Candidatus Methylacidiphilales bacterium]
MRRAIVAYSLLLIIPLLALCLGVPSVRAEVTRKVFLSPEERKTLKPATLSYVDEEGKPVTGIESRIYDPLLVDAYYCTTRKDNCSWNGRLTPGEVIVISWGALYAPQQVLFSAGIPEAGGTIVMKPGTDFRVRCVDDAGTPIPDAKVVLQLKNIRHYGTAATTDKDGWATFPHQMPGSVALLAITAKDHKTTRSAELTIPAAGQELVKAVQLMRQKSFILTAREPGTGKPLEGLKVRIQQVEPHAGFTYPSWNSNLATDAQGQARMDGVESGRLYHIVLDNTTHGTLYRLRPDEKMAQTIEVPRKCNISLTLLNIAPTRDRNLEIAYSERLSENAANQNSLSSEVRDGKAQFTFSVRRDQPIYLYFLDADRKITSEELNSDKLTLELDYNKLKPKPVAKAIVTVKLQPPAGFAAPTGKLSVRWTSKDESDEDSFGADVVDGTATFEVPLDSTVKLTGNNLKGGTLTSPEADNEEGDPDRPEEVIRTITQKSVKLTVPVKPAGYIRVSMREADGKLVPAWYLHARNLSLGSGAPLVTLKNSRSEDAAAEEWYSSGTMPFSRDEFYVFGTNGLRYGISPCISVNADTPVPDAIITLPAAVTRTLRIKDEKGKLITEGIMLNLDITTSEQNYKPGISLKTDQEGTAQFVMNAPMEGVTDKLIVTPGHPQFQSIKIPVAFNDKGEAEIVVPRGKRLFGRYVNMSSDKDAISKCGMGWGCQQLKASQWHTPVDQEGRFEFNNVPDAEIQLLPSWRHSLEVRFPGGIDKFRPDGPEIIVEIHDNKAKG